MKRSTVRFLLLVASAAVLASCGGGGDESGSPTPLSIVPASITVTGAVGACATGAVGQVFVYGGAAPYRLDNTVPAYVTVDKTTVANKGDSFTVTFLGGCLDPGNIVIVDSLDRQVTLTLTNKKGT